MNIFHYYSNITLQVSCAMWLLGTQGGCTTETHLHACVLFVPFLTPMSCPETMSLTTRKLQGAQESKLMSCANCMSYSKICCLMPLDGSGYGCIHSVIYTFFCIVPLLLKGKLGLRHTLIEAGFSPSLPPVKPLLAWLYFSHLQLNKNCIYMRMV